MKLGNIELFPSVFQVYMIQIISQQTFCLLPCNVVIVIPTVFVVMLGGVCELCT